MNSADKLKVEEWPTDRLVEYARNPRKNDPHVDRMAGMIREFGFRIPIVAKSDGTVVDGHLRLKAARKLGLQSVPVALADGLTEAQIKAFRLLANKSVAWSEWDTELLIEELGEFPEGFDLTLTGFDMSEINFLVHGDDSAPEGGLSDNYSREIESPVYAPSAEKPTPAELYDDSKSAELTAEVRASGLPADIERFLSLAAQRHTVFDFAKIADFYAHSGPDVQQLMEKSALVIIDFNKAIEHGFVRLTKHLGELSSISADTDA